MAINNNIFNILKESFQREQRNFWEQRVDTNYFCFCFVLQELHYI